MLYFAKAFDKVPHQRLSLKLESHGFSNKIKDWIFEWLHGRKHFFESVREKDDVRLVGGP